MSTTGATIRSALLGALLATGLVLGGVSSASAAAPTPPVMPSGPGGLLPNGPRCALPGKAGPGYDVSIGNAQDGDTVCLMVGQKLLVLLSAPATAGSVWGRVQVSRPGVLTVAPLTLTLARGLTGTNFKAARVGVVQLTSKTRSCAMPSSGGSGCPPVVSWKATVLVRGPVVVPQLHT